MHFLCFHEARHALIPFHMRRAWEILRALAAMFACVIKMMP
jgi:hypothetical protein